MSNSNVLLLSNLKTHLLQSIPSHQIDEVYNYAVFPPGKLFRPMLAVNLAKDLLGQIDLSSNSPLSYFCSALELHHVYTLLHDDLPCMDDDQFRRGKECTHIKYGEWPALLVGDGLLNISYDLFFRAFKNAPQMLRFAAWSLGPKGLIHGQVMDLSGEIKNSFSHLIRTHQLKTARLIQLSLLGSLEISGVKDFKTYKNFFRFGDAIGVSFQLIDDLIELTELNLPEHELDINPWPRNFSDCFYHLNSYTSMVQHFYELYRLPALSEFLAEYYRSMGKKVEKGLENIITYLVSEKRSESNIRDVVLRLNELSKR